MGRLKRAMQATVVTQGFAITAMLLSLLTVPLYLQWLGDERYGVLLTGMAFASYLMFADAGLTWASILLIAQANGRGDRTEIAAIIRTNALLVTLSSLLVLGLILGAYFILMARPAILGALGHEEMPGLLLAIGASAILSLLISPIYGLFMGVQEMHLSSMYQGIGRLVGLIASVLVATTSAPLGWVFGANVAAVFVVSLIAAVHCYLRHAWAFKAGPFWDRQQIQVQLRTGAKSLTMQVGNVLSGTAPLLAVSSFAGAAWVPYLSIPLALLNAPLNLLNSFNAILQPGYGEAMGREEQAWIAETIRSILGLGWVFIGVLASGFLILAQPFILLWTLGKVEVPPMMLLSVVLIGGSAAVMGVFRFALTGINRHRVAGFSELACGLSSLIACTLAVKMGGFSFVGVGALAAVLLTSGWVLPAQLKKALGTRQPWLQFKPMLALTCAFGVSLLLGKLALMLITPYGLEWAILFSGGVIVSAYFGLVRLLCSDYWLKMRDLILRKLVKNPG